MPQASTSDEPLSNYQPTTVILVNEQDEPTGIADKLEAHIHGWLHRAFSVFVMNSKGELLLQQRAGHKYHCGGLWSNTCCSHPAAGEATATAAQRRMVEELGFCCSLTAKGRMYYKTTVGNGLTEHEIDHIFMGRTDDAAIVLNEDEVQEVRWLPVPEVLAWLERAPQDFTPWFRQALVIALAE